MRWLNRLFGRVPAPARRDPTDDLIIGHKFVATMQLRTPLRVLARHGELHRGGDAPPQLCDPSDGVWVPEVKTFRELGIDIDELQPGAVASDIGPIPADGGDYLQHLLHARRLIESSRPTDERRDALRHLIRSTSWDNYRVKLGGTTKIVDAVFPQFIATIGLPVTACLGLESREVLSPSRIAASTDGMLLEISGIGPARLRAIREACRTAAEPNSIYVDAARR